MVQGSKTLKVELSNYGLISVELKDALKSETKLEKQNVTHTLKKK
jgi:hypothetical protein